MKVVKVRFTSIKLCPHSKGKRRSVPETSVNTPNLIVQTFVPNSKRVSSLVEVAKSIDKKLPEVQSTTKPPVTNAKVNDEYESKHDIRRTKQHEVGTNSLAYHNFVKRRLPILDTSLCLDEEKSYKGEESQRQTLDYGAGSSCEFFSSNHFVNYLFIWS